MNDDTILVPEENRFLVIVEDERMIVIPPEWRILEVEGNMFLGSKIHTANDTRRWIVSYDRWLDNAASIVSANVTSSSTKCTIDKSEVKGKDVIFLLKGGDLNEQVTVTLQMTDNFQNVKTDTIAFTCIAP